MKTPTAETPTLDAPLEQVQSFRAGSMREALDAVRTSLGDEAVIVETRRVTVDGPRKGWRKGDPVEQVEITAGLERLDAPPPPATTVDVGRSPETRSHAESPERPAPPAPRPDEPVTAPPRHPVDYDLDETPLTERLAAIEQALQTLTRDRHGHGVIVDRLVSRGVPLALAKHVVREAVVEDPSTPPSEADLTTALASLIRAEPAPMIRPGEQQRIALVGPTGVGKTTTLAKLAAGFRLRDRYSVGLITVDDYRVAAADQLRTYADLLQCPVRVVADADEMARAIDELAQCDVVLIDTAGYGRPDDSLLAELNVRLDAGGVTDRYLVLSLVSSLASNRVAIDRYRLLKPTAAVLTKLDETPEPGQLVALSDELRQPLHYVTSGQDVPQDIADADAASLARTVLHSQSDR